MVATPVRLMFGSLAAVWLLLISTPSPLQAESPGTVQRAKNWLRRNIATPAELGHYGIELPAADRTASKQAANRPGRLVVVTHGYNSKPEDLACLTREIRSAGHDCGTFRYPNDHQLSESSKLLSRELRRLKQTSPGRQVAIVAHSMGGLVARECLENSALDPGNVDRLILIGTPNHGTQLARYAIGTDVCEHFASAEGGNPLRRFRAAFADGLSEAADDMTPGSHFLDKLNARPRNANVRYTLFLGTGGKVYDKELQYASRVIRKARHLPGLEERANRFAAHVAGMEELVAGKGDGAVAVKRGVLTGVADTVILNFEHHVVAGPADENVNREVHAAVLSRLAE